MNLPEMVGFCPFQDIAREKPLLYIHDLSDTMWHIIY